MNTTKKIDIVLNHNYGFKWYSKNNISVKGYIIDTNEKLYKDEDLINYFNNVKDEIEFEKRLINGKGLYTVIINTKTKTFAAVDQTRTFPLFYTKNNNEFIITDDAYYLKDKNNLKLDNTSKEEFLFTGYVTNKNTLLKDVFQIRAGESITLSNKIKSHFYASYLVEKKEINTSNELEKELFTILDNSVKRLIKSAEGKTIVIPLSGGYDSRVIATLLKKNNYKNVICFSYGDINGYQAKISKTVANKLGYKWFFVDYNKIDFKENFIESKEFKTYYKFANNMVSVFLLQDYFAIRFLTENKLIPNNSIIVPGHSGDFNVGNHLYPYDIRKKSINSMKNSIIKRHYILKSFISNKNIETKLSNTLVKNKLSFSVIENFNLQERQSKFIVNAVRVYEFFGYEHRMIFWDEELVEFFRTLPFNDKLNSKLYFKTIIDNIFIPFNVHIIPPDKNKSRYKRNLKLLSPIFITYILRSFLHRNKNINTSFGYFKVLKPMIKKYNLKSYNVNGILSQWLIKKHF